MRHPAIGEFEAVKLSAVDVLAPNGLRVKTGMDLGVEQLRSQLLSKGIAKQRLDNVIDRNTLDAAAPAALPLAPSLETIGAEHPAVATDNHPTESRSWSYSVIFTNPS